MKRIFLIPLLILVVSILVFGGCAGQAPAPAPAPVPAPVEPITLKVVTALPSLDPHLTPFKAFMDKVKEVSNGELVIDYLGGPEVIGPFDIGQAVKKGVLDLGYLYSGAYEGMVPAVTYAAASLLDAVEEREAGVFDYMAEVHEPYGLHLLGRVGIPDIGPGSIFYIWTTEKKIEKPADMAGLKVAGISPQSDRFIEALGATSVILPFPEVYAALEQGVTNALWNGFMTPQADESYKLTKYMIDHPYFKDNHFMLMNPDAWDRLPTHLQDALMEAVVWTERNSPDMMLPLFEGTRQNYQNYGLEFVRFSAADAEWYRKIAYESEWAYLVEQYPDVAPKLMEMVYTGRTIPPEHVYK